jgi:peptidyl-prolyl cis-trans isomerase A (cyclophilin A)
MKTLLLAALLIVAPAFAQIPTTAAIVPPAPPAAGIVRVRMVTSEGPILIDLEAAKAPLTTANFLKYVDGRRLDGSTIYRVVKVASGYGFIQGGIQNDPKKILPAVAHEPTSKTGLTHTDGTISLPRNAPGTGHGEFFIVVGDIPSMDADPKQAGDNLGYAAFGHVVQGMDLIRPMIERPTSTGGPAVMKGQLLAQPIKILTVRRAN